MTPLTKIPVVCHDAAPALSRTTLEVALLAVRHHALGIRPWAAMPDEHAARAALAKVERAEAELCAALEVA